jgi:DNA-binding NarL/FixJ family response regulator
VATVLVSDDAPLAREALRRAVSSVPGVARVLAVGSGEEAVARYGTDRPDLVLMDVRMPGIGGVEAARRILALHPAASVVMLTMAEDVDGVARAVSAGARGYLVKDVSREELATTVTHALADRAGVVGLRSARARAGVSSSGDAGPSAVRDGAAPTLTERETQVLAGMSRGRSNGEIGKELYLSEDTVKTHARRLFRKLDAADRAQAVAIGFRWGLVH